MGFFDKLKSGLSKTKNAIVGKIDNLFKSFRKVDEDLFDELEELLISADIGVNTTEEILDELREIVIDNKIKEAEDVKVELYRMLRELIGDHEPLKLDTKPSVILVIGVNGVGKTTSIGKISAELKRQGKKVVVAAADTFRAAAAEQLTVWAQRSSADIVRHEEGSDPASVVFDGIAAAKARGADIIIIDTAGRLHNKQNLMNELSKIRRIIGRELPEADIETLLVLDATTGQNGLIQAKSFKESADISGIVLTKLDGTARGGIVFAIADELKLPVKYIGVGEQADDLMPFEAETFAEEILK